jgi:hypothetical protein
MTATYVSNFPEYWVWVLPDSTENVGVIPAFQGTSTVFNVERFTKCVINDAAIDVELLQGACVRIDYENRRLRGGAYVVNIVNNEPDFANAVIKELEGIPSAGGGFGACDERGVSVMHPSGDAVGTHGEGSATPSTAADIKRVYPEAAAVEGLAEKIVEVANLLDIQDPGWLANAINFESGFSPTIRNGACMDAYPTRISEKCATGLIQFMPATATNLGTTTDALAAMGAVEQMDWVYKYFSPYKGRLGSSADIYMTIFFPVAVGHGPGYSIYNWYVQNKSVSSAQNFLSLNGGIRTSGDYQALADRHSRLPTHLTPSGAVT